jgi:hypothetical protein
MDLILNFLCSCHDANIDPTTVVVILGQADLIPLVEDMGAHAMHDGAFGPIPKDAADNYGDGVFGRLMWLKATSIYTAASAGFNVLFQVFLFNCRQLRAYSFFTGRRFGVASGPYSSAARI